MPKRKLSSEVTSRKTRKSPASARKHPLAEFEYTDSVPITTHDSPVSTHSFFSSAERKIDAQKMERKLLNHLADYNIPCVGIASERRAMGECPEDVFDTYMSATMPPHLYSRKEEYTPHIGINGPESITNIIYEFTYPNFPSFGNHQWAIYRSTIDMSKVAESLGKFVSTPRYFKEAQHRCIAKKLYVVLDTSTEIYFVHLTHWVQKKVESKVSKTCDFAWVDVF